MEAKKNQTLLYDKGTILPEWKRVWQHGTIQALAYDYNRNHASDFTLDGCITNYSRSV